ncbi:MAG: T9SS type A sorting domain-containing protein, partial [Nonlabens sp.]
ENTMAACGIPTAQATFNLSKINIPAGQTVIPDDNFEQELIALGYDTVLDNLLDSANVSAVNTLDISNKGISDLTGLEAFVALDTLRANDNSIVTFNSLLVNNARFVDFASNPIVDVDMSNSNSITFASFFFNSSLQNIDISGAVNLEFFDGSVGLYTTIDTSNNPNLKTLRLQASNQLTSIDITQNPLLERLELLLCPLLTGIDITQNPQLEYLRFGTINFDRTSTEYPITSIDFTNNVNLIELINLGSRISNPNFSNLSSIEELTWVDSEVTSFDFTNNRTLLTVEVSDNLLSGTLNLSNLSNIQRVFVLNNQLNSVTLPSVANSFIGINANNNQITGINVDPYSTMEFLSLDDNLLTTVNLTNNNNLSFLSLNNNNLSMLNLINNNALTDVAATGNQITSVDLNASPALTSVELTNNDLMSLKVNNGANSLITTFDATGNPNLICIEISDIPYMNSTFATNIDATASFNMNCATASIDEVQLELSLFPNPTINYVNISVLDHKIETVSLYDISGRMVIQTFPKEIDTSYRLNTASLATGQYLLVVDTDAGKVVENLIKN